MTRHIVILGDNACGGYALYANGRFNDPSGVIGLILNNRDKTRDELKAVLMEHGFQDDVLDTCDSLQYVVTGCEFLFSTQHSKNDGPLITLNFHPEVCLYNRY